MQLPKYIIGCDISADDFAASCIDTPDSVIFEPIKFLNDFDGFDNFIQHLVEYNINPADVIICMEATGVYTENLCYYLASKGFTLCVEAPHKIKQKTKDSPRKNDFIDSLDVAEYAYRYIDKLTKWNPLDEILEQIKVLLSTREHLTVQVTANKNARIALKHKHYQTPLANRIFDEAIIVLKGYIKQIDKEIKELIKKDDSFKKYISLAKSVPGVGLLLAANLLVLTKGFTENVTSKDVAAYVGICPYEYISGTSVRKKTKSKRGGPPKLRKLLYLAALSVRTHNQKFKDYFLRKVNEGKNKHLVINNIENKLLKIVFAVINSKTPYVKNHNSVFPGLLISA